MNNARMFDMYLDAWGLVPDGEPIQTHSSDLLPVRRDGMAAMLKIARNEEEQRGHGLMAWWNGDGAARVLAHQGAALLLERARGGSLAALCRDGRDDDAVRIICGSVDRLHRIRVVNPPELVPLTRWFADLDAAAGRGGMFARAADTARLLLSAPLDETVLHGDIHHGNILDFGDRGWLAIDPKDCGANVVSTTPTCSAIPIRRPRPIPRRFADGCHSSPLKRGWTGAGLPRWILAWVGLSVLWPPFDPKRTEAVLRFSELAAAEIDQ